MKTISLAIGRIIFGIIGLGAIVYQLHDSIKYARSILNFFSFFTIESNILAVIILLALGSIALIKKNDDKLALIRGAITLYMTMTGIIYVLLLSGNEVALQTTVPWVNITLHYVLPLVLIVDWLVFPPRVYISFQKAMWWLVFPIVYLVYSLVRGSYKGWYPYPFINPVVNGWPTVVVMSILIAFGVVILAGLLALRTRANKPQRAM